MFAKLFTLSALAILAVATPSPAPAASCATGPIQCCQQTGTASDPTIAKVLAGLGVPVQGVDVLVGLTCSAVSVVGVGSGGSCNANAVCCQDNSLGGVAAIGCVPVSL